jgi:hypothetical protein
LPKLRHAVWKRIADKLFPSGANVVLMTDSASCYTEVQCSGIVDKHRVNHSEMEFARSTRVLSNARTRATENGTAGTFVIDSEWRRLKEGVPGNLSRKTASGRARVEYYVRAQQWRRFRRNEDLWPRYCDALHQWRARGAAYWIDEQGSEEPEQDPVVESAAVDDVAGDGGGQLCDDIADELVAAEKISQWGERFFEVCFSEIAHCTASNLRLGRGKFPDFLLVFLICGRFPLASGRFSSPLACGA